MSNNRVAPSISVVIPCYNEAESVAACHQRMSTVLSSLGETYEIIYVDDGSHDATVSVISRLQDSDPQIVLARLSRNFGHQIAVSAGMEMARGLAVVIIDADLQDPPELIPQMLDHWRQGYQVVYGVRESREGESGFKLWTAKSFYRFINRLSDIDIPLDTGDFRLIDRIVVDAFKRMPEKHRLLRAMSSWIGYSQIGLPYHRARRAAGETKYPLRKMLTLALDGIVSFSIVPLRLVTFIGFASAMLAFLGIIYSLTVRLFTHSWVHGWAISFIAMLFMGAAQLFGMGILGEYVGRIYTESKQRPLYLLRGPNPIAHPPIEALTTVCTQELSVLEEVIAAL